MSAAGLVLPASAAPEEAPVLNDSAAVTGDDALASAAEATADDGTEAETGVEADADETADVELASEAEVADHSPVETVEPASEPARATDVDATPPADLAATVGVEALADTADLEWQSITFGQSTDLSFSSNVLPEKVGVNHVVPEVPGTIEGEIFIESRGGKLAPGHDGLTFYYVELDPNEHNFVLEAEVTVDQLGPETGANRNGQEGAGIMVRDVNGGARQDPMIPGFEEVPAASNLAGVSMMRHGASPIMRTGVTEPWGNLGSQWSAAGFPGVPSATTDEPVVMRLERTDTEFVMSATFPELDGAPSFERRLEGADWVQVIDPDSMTVGFFASRNAAVRFNDASLTLSDANTQPRPEEPAPEAPTRFEIVSGGHSGSTDYPFRARPSHDGTVTIAVDGETVGEPITVTGGDLLTETVTLLEGANTVSATFIPTGGEPITQTLEVEVRLFDVEDLVVSPDGAPDGEGTVEDPLDVSTAIRFVTPGSSVLMRGGTYTPGGTIDISAGYSGLEGAPKTLTAYGDEDVVIDGQRAMNIVLRLDADHWNVNGLTLTDATSNGMRMSGSHNVIEGMTFNYNGDTGFQMTGPGSDTSRWPAHNLVLNSESHDNRDETSINADGFAAKLGVGPGNVFRGNISHHNIDDGWDFYNRTNEGANFPITLEGNIAHSNGKLSDGTEGSGTGVGFKLGGEGLPVEHVVVGNLAYDNNLDGFSDNFNPGRMTLTNNTSIDNQRYNYIFRSSPYFAPEEQGVFRNNLSLRTGEGGADTVAGDVDDTNFLYDGEATVNGEGLAVTAEEFVSLDAPQARYARGEDGAFVWTDYTRPTPTSFLNTAGTDAGHVGALAGIIEEVPSPTPTEDGEEDETPPATDDDTTPTPPEGTETPTDDAAGGGELPGTDDAAGGGELPTTGVSTAAALAAAAALLLGGLVTTLTVRRRARI